MKLLKIWGWILFAASILLYLIGIVSGAFSETYGVLLFGGDSPRALFLHALSILFLVLAITIFFISIAISEIKEKMDAE